MSHARRSRNVRVRDLSAQKELFMVLRKIVHHLDLVSELPGDEEHMFGPDGPCVMGCLEAKF